MEVDSNNEVKLPKIYFVLKETESGSGQIEETLEYPFMALGGIPSVGDLVKFENLYRIYLRRYDYSELKELKIYLYMIKVIE